MKLVVFGAGNIGRSFVGQLFARAGYQVVFVDIDARLVEALNREGRYRIEIKDRRPGEIWVEGVSAVDGRDGERVAKEVGSCDMLATAVGTGSLPHIYPGIARGLSVREKAGRPPLDIIICENLRNAAGVFGEGLREHLPAGFPIEERVGLIETSIGKMVPIMPEEVRRREPLVLYAEAYNTLILDAKGFRNAIPEVPGLDPKENMAAYVDRKAFIHNCGHAVCAYVGYLAHEEAVYIWEMMADEEVRETARRAMWESGRALMKRYPDEFDERNQGEHIEDLLSRFGNEALGDTIYRVGRDLGRKLSRGDRLVGALLMDAEERVAAPATTLGAAAGLMFRGSDERGELFGADEELRRRFTEHGIDWALSEVCGLDEAVEAEARIAAGIRAAYADLRERKEGWLEGLLETG
ncbi:MAG: mannitol-1-phosphate 5-dehydrogenase [Armatimonadota bacterium]|nr:MAG: mannitol-1-phosphate 5-dehydrogenase [Armatimonadota bacterium]